MRTQYLLDDVRRRTGEALRRIVAREAQDRRVRRRRWALFAGVLAGSALATAGAWMAWHWAFAPAPVAGPAPEASVPEHQRSGPLANPWGSGTPVVGEQRGPEAAAAAAASAAPEAAAVRPDVALATPAGRDAVRAALARLRGSAKAVDFVTPATEGREPAALVAAWMAERQCRQVAQWRMIVEWRTRASNPGAPVDPNAPLPTAGVHPHLRTLLARCADLPDNGAVNSALAAAGFTGSVDVADSTHRPLDLAGAAAIGDTELLATVIDATSVEELGAFIAKRVRPAAAQEVSSEVLKAALWLASCRAGTARSSHAACAEHPAVWQACTQQGLCDVRDLHDLLLRTMPTDQWHASERLAGELASSIGR